MNQSPDQHAESVRHWTLYHQMPNALQDACRIQEAEGFRLDRIIPYTDQQSVAVFVRAARSEGIGLGAGVVATGGEPKVFVGNGPDCEIAWCARPKGHEGDHSVARLSAKPHCLGCGRAVPIKGRPWQCQCGAVTGGDDA